MSTLPYPHGTGPGQIGEGVSISTTPVSGTTKGMLLEHGRELTSEAMNRAAYAVDANVDHIWSRMKDTDHPLAVRKDVDFTSTGDDGVALTGDVYVGNPSTSDVEDIFQLLDSNGARLEVGGTEVHVTDVRDVDGGVSIFQTGFHNGAWLDFDQTIPSGVQFTVVYGIKSDLDTLDAGSLLILPNPPKIVMPATGIQHYDSLQYGIDNTAEGELFGVRRLSSDPFNTDWTISPSGQGFWHTDGRYLVFGTDLIDSLTGSVLYNCTLQPDRSAGVFVNDNGWVHWYDESGTLHYYEENIGTANSFNSPESGATVYAAAYDGKNLIVGYKDSGGYLKMGIYQVHPTVNPTVQSTVFVHTYDDPSTQILVGSNSISRMVCVGRYILVAVDAGSSTYLYAVDRERGYTLAMLVDQVVGTFFDAHSADGASTFVFYYDSGTGTYHVASYGLGMWLQSATLEIDSELQNYQLTSGHPGRASIGRGKVYETIHGNPSSGVMTDRTFLASFYGHNGMGAIDLDHVGSTSTDYWYTDGESFYWYDEVNGELTRFNGSDQGVGLWRKTRNNEYLPHHAGWQAIPV